MSRGDGTDGPQFFYCLKHQRVEGRDGCRARDRLGPYRSEAEAARALESAAERTEAWDNDPKWNDEPDEAGDEAGDGAGDDAPDAERFED